MNKLQLLHIYEYADLFVLRITFEGFYMLYYNGINLAERVFCICFNNNITNKRIVYLRYRRRLSSEYFEYFVVSQAIGSIVGSSCQEIVVAVF